MPVVYEVKCTNCSSSLNITKITLDSTDDLIVWVDSCSTCLDEACEEAHVHGFKEGEDCALGERE